MCSRPITNGMDKKQLTGIIIGVLIVAAAGTAFYFGAGIIGNDVSENGGEAFQFYRDWDSQFKDCGNEELRGGFGYNKSMRECFKEAYDGCRLAKIHQKLLTIEGDPIYTTAVVEGEAPLGCKAHVYVDSRDRFGKSGKSDTICYSVILDSSSGQESLFFDDCEDGTQRFFY